MNRRLRPSARENARLLLRVAERPGQLLGALRDRHGDAIDGGRQRQCETAHREQRNGYADEQAERKLLASSCESQRGLLPQFRGHYSRTTPSHRTHCHTSTSRRRRPPRGSSVLGTLRLGERIPVPADCHLVGAGREVQVALGQALLGKHDLGHVASA